jgi:hypothetical protein
MMATLCAGLGLRSRPRVVARRGPRIAAVQDIPQECVSRAVGPSNVYIEDAVYVVFLHETPLLAVIFRAS